MFHPGGLAVLKMYAGTDCTKEFYALHTTAVLEKYHDRLVVGRYLGESGQKPTETSLKRPEKTAEDLVSRVPYSDIPLLRENWIRMPWWTDSHREFLFALRSTFEPFVQECYESERNDEFVSSELHQVCLFLHGMCAVSSLKYKYVKSVYHLSSKIVSSHSVVTTTLFCTVRRNLIDDLPCMDARNSARTASWRA